MTAREVWVLATRTGPPTYYDTKADAMRALDQYPPDRLCEAVVYPMTVEAA